MGLLDVFLNGTGDPQKDAAINRGLLQAGLALMQSRGKLFPALGQAGMVGLQASDQVRQQQAQQQRAGLQDQLLKGQVADQQRQQDINALPGQFYRAPSQPGTDATGGMDTAQENPNNASGPGGFDMLGYVNALMAKAPQQVLQLQAALKKDTTPIKVGPNESLVNPQTLQSVFTNTKKEEGTTDWQNYQNAVNQGEKASFTQWMRENKKSGASNVSVSTGQKGLDNTLKLRSDFRSEPVYKAHQEMQSAYAQIQQSLKQASPAGDLAGATKMMKILDPGSVVRESELGMAMAASGLMDRVQNYAQNIIKGTKLTPTQRADFQKLADALYGESVKQYNTKRGEYQGIAERNQLPIEDVIGKEGQGPAPAVVNFSDLK
jgi:hypothetical protein